MPIARWLYDFIRLHHEEVIPYRGHIEPQIVLNKGSKAMAMLQLYGTPFELASPGLRNARASRLNTLLRQIADPSLEICFHMVHHRRVSEPPQPVSSNPFVREMMEQYQRTALRNMFSNDWFITAILDPPTKPTRAIREYIPFLSKDKTLELDPGQRRQLEEIMYQIASTLSDYDPKRLGIEMVPTELDGVDAPITGIGTALRLIRTAQYFPVPHTWGSLGAAIYDEEVTVRPLYFNTGIGEERYGAILCFLDYPAKPRNGMLNALMSVPHPLVMSHSFRYKSLGALASAYGIILSQMKNAGSMATKMMKKIEDTIGEVENAEAAPGRHNFQVAVYAKNPVDLESIVANVKSIVAQQGAATIKRERNYWHDGGLESQYYGQLPGSQHIKPAPGDITTLDIAAMVSLDNFPAGKRSGYWGASPIRLRSRAGTAVDLIMHDEDVAHFAGIGPNGRGKTVWGGVLMSAHEPVMGPDGIRLVIDKDDSNRLWIEAQGGHHQRLQRNMPSGLAPLRAYDDSPRVRAFLFGLYKDRIESDGQGLINNDEEIRLARGIARQLKMPRQKRSMGGIREFLGYRDSIKGAGPRFERWCKGGSKGWLLDNDEQTVHIGPGLQGYDFGDLLPREGLAYEGEAEVAAACISYELRNYMDGRKIFCLFDECKFYIRVLERLIEDFTLTGRKKELVCGLLFQQPEHMTESAVGSTLVAQMRRKYVFPDANYKPKYLREIGMTEAAIRQVMGDMTIGNARRVLIWDAEPVIVDFDLTGIPQLDILSARPRNVALFDEIRREMLDAPITDVVETFHHRFAEERKAA